MRNCYVVGEVYSTNGLFGSTSVAASTTQYHSYFVAQIGSYAPLLSIAQVGNKAVISWPVWASDFEIQGKIDLSPAENWTTLSSPIVTIGDDNVTTYQLSDKTRFYRLRKD